MQLEVAVVRIGFPVCIGFLGGADFARVDGGEGEMLRSRGGSQLPGGGLEGDLSQREGVLDFSLAAWTGGPSELWLGSVAAYPWVLLVAENTLRPVWDEAASLSPLLGVVDGPGRT